MLVKQRSLGPQVIGADNGRIAAGITAADPAFFQNGHVADTMLFCKVISCCESVPAAADDDDVILALRLRTTPRLAPVTVVADRVP